MKRFWVFLILLILFFISYGGNCIASLINHDDITYSIYSNQNIEDKSFESVRVGSGYIISCDNKDANRLFSLLKYHIYGQSLSFEADKNEYVNIINNLNFKIVSREKFEDMYNIYGFGDFGEAILFDGKKINIQLSYRKGNIVIGCPIILGSY